MGSEKPYFLTKFAFIFALALAVCHPVHAEEDHGIEGLDAVPISREELQKLPQSSLPAEVREELKVPVNPARNTAFDYVLVSVRTTLNAASISLGFIINLQAPVATAILPGLLGGAMSGSLQLYHAQISHWLEHKSQMKTWYDLPGFFRVSNTERASFIESFFVKEFGVGIIYLNGIQILSGLLKIQPDIFSWRPLESAAMSLASEGVFFVLIAHLSEKYASEFPSKAALVWRLSKISAILVSVISTFGSAMYLMKQPWAHWVPISLGTLGAATYLITSDKIKKVGRKCGDFLKSLWRS